MRDSNQMEKLKLLLERQMLKSKKNETSRLFNECIAALGEGTIILSNEKSLEIYNLFENEYTITSYGRVEWSKYEFDEFSTDMLRKLLFNSTEHCYLLWSHGFDPIIITDMNKIMAHYDDVTAVSPDVWLYRENEYVIELFHNGEIRKSKS